MDDILKRLLEHYIQTENELETIDGLMECLAETFSVLIDHEIKTSHLPMRSAQYQLQVDGMHEEKDSNFSQSKSSQVIAQRKLHSIVQKIIKTDGFKQFRSHILSMCARLIRDLWQLNKQWFAHDDHQLLMELKDPAFDLIHGTDSNDENLILGLSSFSLGQSIKGVPQKEIENIVGLIISDGISVNVRASNLQKLSHISPVDLINSTKALESFLGHLNFILRESKLFNDTIIIIGRILESREEVSWIKCSVSLSRVTLSIMRNEKLHLKIKRRFVNFILRILHSLLELFSAEFVESVTLKNSEISFPVNGFLTTMASSDKTAQCSVRSIIAINFSEILVDIIRHFLNKSSKYTENPSNNEETTKSIRDYCFQSSLLLRSLKFRDLVSHLVAALGMNMLRESVEAVFQFFLRQYIINRKQCLLHFELITCLLIENSKSDYFAKFITHCLNPFFDFINSNTPETCPSIKSVEKFFIKLLATITESMNPAELLNINLKQQIIMLIGRSINGVPPTQSEQIDVKLCDNQQELIRLLLQLMRRCSPPDIVQEFAELNLNFGHVVQLLTSEALEAPNLLSHEHLLLLFSCGFQNNTITQFRTWERILLKQLEPYSDMFKKGSVIEPQISENYFIAYRSISYLLPLPLEILHLNIKKSTIKFLHSFLSPKIVDFSHLERTELDEGKAVQLMPESRISKLEFLDFDREQKWCEKTAASRLFTLITQPRALLSSLLSFGLFDYINEQLAKFETHKITTDEMINFVTRIDHILNINLDVAQEIRTRDFNFNNRMLQAVKKARTDKDIAIVDELLHNIFYYFSHGIIASESERWLPYDCDRMQLIGKVMKALPESLYRSNVDENVMLEKDSTLIQNNEDLFYLSDFLVSPCQCERCLVFNNAICQFSMNKSSPSEFDEYDRHREGSSIPPIWDKNKTIAVESSKSFLFNLFSRTNENPKESNLFDLIMQFTDRNLCNDEDVRSSSICPPKQAGGKRNFLNTKMCGDGWFVGVLEYALSLGLAENKRDARNRATSLRFFPIQAPDWFIAALWLASGLDDINTMKRCEWLLVNIETASLECFWPAVSVLSEQSNKQSNNKAFMFTFDDYFARAISIRVFPTVCQFLCHHPLFREVQAFIEESELPSLLTLLCFYTNQAYLGILPFKGVQAYIALCTVGGIEFQAMHFCAILLHLTKRSKLNIQIGQKLFLSFLRPTELFDFEFEKYIDIFK